MSVVIHYSNIRNLFSPEQARTFVKLFPNHSIDILNSGKDVLLKISEIHCMQQPISFHGHDSILSHIPKHNLCWHMNESFAPTRSAITSDMSNELAYSITYFRQFEYILFLLNMMIERCDAFISSMGSSNFWSEPNCPTGWLTI